MMPQRQPSAGLPAGVHGATGGGPGNSLASTVGLVARGDADALAALYDATVSMVYAIAEGLIRDPLQAEETVLDVFQYVWKRAANFGAGRGSVRSWLTTITRGRSMDRMRTVSARRGYEIELPEEGTQPALTCAAPTPEVDAIQAERDDTLARALRSLGPENALCEHRDNAWSFVVGNTTDEERASFLGHLVEGCAACGAEVARARGVVADLDVALADRTLFHGQGSTPGPGIRERLLASVDRGPRTSFASHVEQATSSPLMPTEMRGVSIAAGSEEGWQSTDLEGIAFKTLAEDTQRRTATALVRMAPGSAYPAHRHAAREECFVLSGRGRLGPPAQRTEQGCLLLIASSLDDEPV